MNAITICHLIIILGGIYLLVLVKRDEAIQEAQRKALLTKQYGVKKKPKKKKKAVNR